jgi:hypothetical protein
MPGKKFQRCFARFLPHASWRTVLLVALVILPGCSNIALPKEDIPASGADPAYGKLVAAQIKSLFKNLSPNDAVEISESRWVQSDKGWSWLACVHFQDRGHRRTYALFLKGSEIVDARYAVQTDACEAQIYSPLDLATGAIRPAAAVGDPGPLY